MTGDLLYAYGVVRAGFDAGRLPSGIDDASVAVITEGKAAALVSRLPERAYAPAEIEKNSGEVEWLSPRAMAHDRILTWAQEHGGVIPLPMFSMWGSEASLTATLRERAASLEAVFQRVANADEFGLRVHRRDAVMLEHIADLDEDVAALRRDAAAASPGQRYLLERKMAERSKQALRVASQRMAREMFDDLTHHAREAIARPLVPAPSGANEATMVLNGAFLVSRDRLDAFRSAVAAHIRAEEPRGMVFDFTGPWPPYNFVAADGSSVMSDSGRQR